MFTILPILRCTLDPLWDPTLQLSECSSSENDCGGAGGDTREEEYCQRVYGLEHGGGM